MENEEEIKHEQEKAVEDPSVNTEILKYIKKKKKKKKQRWIYKSNQYDKFILDKKWISYTI